MSILNKQLIDFLRKLAQNTFHSMGKKILHGDIGYEITFKDVAGVQGGVLLSSFGGSLYEGLAMADVVAAEMIPVQAFGVVASAATLVLAASPQRTGTPNSRYLMHNPLFGNFYGDNRAFKDAADDLERERILTIDFYEKHLAINRQEIEAIMNAGAFFGPEKALEIGLIQSIEDYDGDASTLVQQNMADWFLFNKVGAAILNSGKPKNDKPAKQQPMKKPENGFEKMLNRIAKALNITPQNLVLTAQNGDTLDFGDEVETQADIVVGTTATVNGEPATGTYTLTDGTVLTFEAGAVTLITPPATEANTDANATNEALQAAQAQIENLQQEKVAALAEKAAFEARAIQAESQLSQIQSRLTAIDAKLAQNRAEQGEVELNSPGTPQVEPSGFTFKGRKKSK